MAATAAASPEGRSVIKADMSELNRKPAGAATDGEVMELDTDKYGMPIHPGERPAGAAPCSFRS